MPESKKRKRKPKRHPQEITYVIDGQNEAAEVKDHKVLKRVLLGLFFFFGTLIIITAIILVLNIVNSDNVNPEELSSNFTEFLSSYNEYPNLRDFPDGLEVSSAEFNYKGTSYTLTVKIKNTDKDVAQINVQMYYGSKFTDLTGASNPFVSYGDDDPISIEGGKEYEFSVTGALSKNISEDELKEAIEGVYIELITTHKDAGRILQPVTFTESDQ